MTKIPHKYFQSPKERGAGEIYTLHSFSHVSTSLQFILKLIEHCTEHAS